MAIGLVLATLLSLGFIFQAPTAVADDSGNPLTALWDAILSLQSRDDDLQSQIDELKAGRITQPVEEAKLVSDLYAKIEIETNEDGHTLVQIRAGNHGPDRADEVKVTAFYLMPLFDISLIDSDFCEDKSRGIIECSAGVLEGNQERIITIDAIPRESGEENTWTVDISSTTEDSDYSNNHVTYDFETGAGELIFVEQPAPETTEPEQSEQPTSETGELQATVANQTETEVTSTVNQTSAAMGDSSTNSTNTQQASQNSEPDESAPEPVAEETEEGSTEPAAPAEEQSQSQEEQGTSDESGAEAPEEQGATESSDSEETLEDSNDGQEPAEGGQSSEGGESP
jgi:hypothetical protein